MQHNLNGWNTNDDTLKSIEDFHPRKCLDIDFFFYANTSTWFQKETLKKKASKEYMLNKNFS